MRMTGFSLFSSLSSTRAAALEFFYGQFGQVLTTIGSVVEALDLVQGQIRHPAVASAVADVRRVVASGMTVAQAMGLRPDVFPAEHAQLVEAGESAGAMPDALRRLAARVDHSRRMQREWRGALAYPALLIHGVAVVLPIGLLGVSGGAYVSRVLFHLIVLYAVVGGVWFAWRRIGSGDPTRLPFVGRIFHTMRAGSLCWAIGSLYEAGVNVVPAVERSLTRRLDGEPAVQSALTGLREGDTGLADFASTSGLFPADTVSILRIAQESGNLGEALLNEGGRLDELGVHRMRTTLRVTGRTIYVVAAITVAYVVIRFYASYFGALGTF